MSPAPNPTAPPSPVDTSATPGARTDDAPLILPAAAFQGVAPDRFAASALTRGPWDPKHQHAGPPIALVCRAVEQLATPQGLTHIGRITANLLRPVPIAELEVQVSIDYQGRNSAHYSARLLAQGKELGRFTALAQRPLELRLPESLPGHPLPQVPRPPLECESVRMPFDRRRLGYSDWMENRLVSGDFFAGPCVAWFRMRRPLVEGESPSGYQRAMAAADSGNGISAVLPLDKYLFVNNDLSVHMLREPVGEWICLDARTSLAPNGCGIAESQLFDEQGLIGRAIQSLSVRAR